MCMEAQAVLGKIDGGVWMKCSDFQTPHFDWLPGKNSGAVPSSFDLSNKIIE